MVIRLHLRGKSRTQAMQEIGYSPESYKMWSDPRFQALLSEERFLLQSELLDCRESLVYEVLTLARDDQTPKASRIAAYRLLGQWAGLDKPPTKPGEGAPALPGKPQDVGLPPDCGASDVVSTLRAKHDN